MSSERRDATEVNDAEKRPPEKIDDELSLGVCPAPAPPPGVVLLGHGSGGRLSHRLLDELILPAFSNAYLDRRDDQAVVEIGASRIAFTTDGFVVTPLFFPGADIGKLAIHGTVNDLAMAGARPLFLSASFIVEEGLPMETLARVVASMREAAAAAGVQIVTGDTKVVNRGCADKLFVTTSGIGVVPPGLSLSADRVRAGDVVIVSGTIADHGVAVMAAREDLGLGDALQSDSAPLYGLVEAMLATGARLRCLRDPTRGGVAAALSEIASTSRVALEVEEASLPIRPAVRGVCELLGLDPLFVANEGKLIAFVDPDDSDRLLAAMRNHALGRDAAIIGRAREGISGEIVVVTCVGGQRLLELPYAEPLPRIC